jgi:hypothetical protein
VVSSLLACSQGVPAALVTQVFLGSEALGFLIGNVLTMKDVISWNHGCSEIRSSGFTLWISIHGSLSPSPLDLGCHPDYLFCRPFLSLLNLVITRKFSMLTQI